MTASKTITPGTNGTRLQEGSLPTSVAARCSLDGVTHQGHYLTEPRVLIEPSSMPPSRDTNPFATCWTSPNRIQFAERGDQTVEQVLNRFREAKGRGALVGHHGSGKSTLLRALRLKLIEQERQVVWFDLTANRFDEMVKGLPTQTTELASQPVWLLEGFERTSLVNRHKILWASRRYQAEVIVTLHHESSLWPWGFQTIASLKPSQKQIERIFRQLTERDSSKLVCWHDAMHSWKHVNGNLRELWFELYTLHEKRRRLRTNSSAKA